MDQQGEGGDAPQTFLSAKAILALQDRTYKDVFVPFKWQTWVRLQSLTGKERDDFEASVESQDSKGNKRRNMRNIRARLLALSMVDANNNNVRMFTSAPEVEALGDKDAEPLSFLFVEACELSGITKRDREVLAKNSDGTDGGSEPTESQAA